MKHSMNYKKIKMKIWIISNITG